MRVRFLLGAPRKLHHTSCFLSSFWGFAIRQQAEAKPPESDSGRVLLQTLSCTKASDEQAGLARMTQGDEMT